VANRSEVTRLRTVIAEALDELEAGNQREAVAILLDALESVSERGTLFGPPPCSICGVRTWQPERHIYSAHHRGESLRRAA